jgi:pimeloyl-ACP methyl ester carboxylesterase
MSHAACFTLAAAGLALCAALVGNAASVCAQSAPAAGTTKTGATMWVTTTQRVKTKVYESAGLGPHPILIIVLHGDSPDGPPTYQYRFAERAAAAIPDTVVAAVLRPGYSDGEDRSDGMRGETTGDNYTPEVINAVATALSELKNKYHPRRVILVGHSGGAAIAGDLLSQQGVTADAALLVSCPCDLAAWRKHMQSIKGGAIWDRPVRSLSPIEVVDGIPASTKFSLLVGSDDRIAPAELTVAYADALRKHNVAADVTIAPGLPHNILLEPITMDRLKDIAGATDAGR